MPFSSNAARNFLSDVFSDEEFATFCFDFFPEVEKDFAASMRKSEKIQLLLRYCSERNAVQALFQALQLRLPEQYHARFGDKPPPAQFEATLALGDTPTSMEIHIHTLQASTQRRIVSQTEHIQYFRKLARGVVILGLMIALVMILPIQYPITLAVRGIAAGGGIFLCSLSTLQYLVIAHYQEIIDDCKAFLEYLESLKKQPVLDDDTRAQIQFYMKQAFPGVWKVKPV